MMDFLVRSFNQIIPKDKQKVDSFAAFVEQYVNPNICNSKIIQTRKFIRSDKSLNNFYHENEEILLSIFQSHFEGQNGFTLKSAQNMISPLDLVDQNQIL